MKQFIIISLGFVILVLSGCKNAEKGCKEKGEGWYWNVANKKCIETSKTEEDCTAKGEGWTWDQEKEKCIAPPSETELTNKEKCEAKGDGWYWNEDKVTDQGEEYKKCNRDISADCKDPAKPVVKNPSPLECVAPYIIIIESVGDRLLKLGSPGRDDDETILFNCHVMDKQKSDWYIPFYIEVSVYDGNEESLFGLSQFNICEPGGTGSPPSCPSSEGVYEVQAGRSGFFITKVTKTIERLRELGCFEYMIHQDGPL
ncbi:MAG: hypothetical protein OXM55_01075 [Bdellovibrionales bacterium]|nr:hypothetical protein [Bdellovibrionales bacterium]